jgi:HEAT repeat protein
MSDKRAVETAADALSTHALYSRDKDVRLRAIRGLARLVRDSPTAADTLATIANYSRDPELKRAALDALSGEG